MDVCEVDRCATTVSRPGDTLCRRHWDAKQNGALTKCQGCGRLKEGDWPKCVPCFRKERGEALTSTETAPRELRPGERIGRYVVRRKLAEGGMAEIYLCTLQGALGIEKEVVVKRIRPTLAQDREVVDMFTAEARIASQLNHANLIQVFDFDRHENTHFLAMEFVDGKSLWEVRQRCKERAVRMPSVLVAYIGREVARALHYAHKMVDNGRPLQLVHRDVSPQNILLSYGGAVKLTDFGIAKAATRLTTAGMLKGKFAYMAPEQARGQPVDARTDIFSLGIVLWELLTNTELFSGDSDLSVLRAVQERPILQPSEVNPDVDSQLVSIVMKALHRDAGERFQTAQELERSLGEFQIVRSKATEDTDVGAFISNLFTETTKPPVAQSSAALVPESTAVLPADNFKDGNTLVMPGKHGLQPVKQGEIRPTSDPSPQGKTGSRAWITLCAVLGGLTILGLSFVLGTKLSRFKRLGEHAAVTIPPPAAPKPTAPVSIAPPPQIPIQDTHDGGSQVAPSTIPAQGFGFVLIKAVPWAKLSVDGISRGDIEGQRLVKLEAGQHRIRLANSGASRTQDVQVDAGATVLVKFEAGRSQAR